MVRGGVIEKLALDQRLERGEISGDRPRHEPEVGVCLACMPGEEQQGWVQRSNRGQMVTCGPSDTLRLLGCV